MPHAVEVDPYRRAFRFPDVVPPGRGQQRPLDQHAGGPCLRLAALVSAEVARDRRRPRTGVLAEQVHAHGPEALQVGEYGGRLRAEVPPKRGRADPEGVVGDLAGEAVVIEPLLAFPVLVAVPIVHAGRLPGQQAEQQPHGRGGHLDVAAAAHGHDEGGGDGSGQGHEARHARRMPVFREKRKPTRCLR